MKTLLLKHKKWVIIVGMILIAVAAFVAGMAIKSTFAQNGDNFISAEEAKTTALENVGVSADNATFTTVKLERDDHPASYEIDFHTASHEYDFEIDAVSGEILNKESEVIHTEDNANVPPETAANKPSATAAEDDGANGEYIGTAKAKRIALSHAGVSEAHATFTSTSLDSEDGVQVYEIDFIANHKEYDYEVHAITGKVISYDIEAADDEYGDD